MATREGFNQGKRSAAGSSGRRPCSGGRRKAELNAPDARLVWTICVACIGGLSRVAFPEQEIVSWSVRIADATQFEADDYCRAWQLGRSAARPLVLVKLWAG